MKHIRQIAAHIFLPDLQHFNNANSVCARLSNANPFAACRPGTLKLMDSRELTLLSANIWTKTSFSLRGGACVGPQQHPARRRDVDIV